MKRLLLPLITALVLPNVVNAEISDKIHNRCKDVKDYMGCVNSHSSNSSQELAEDYYMKGNEELQKQNYSNAYTYAKRVIKYDPNSYKGYCLRGFALVFMKGELGKRYARAVPDFNKCIELGFTQSKMVYNFRAIGLKELGDLEGSCRDVKKAWELGYEYANYILKKCNLLD